MIAGATIAAMQLALRAALAAMVAMAVAQWSGMEFPLLAMISAVIVTDLSPLRTRQLALPRLAGTVLGAGIGAVTASVVGPEVWGIALGILIAMFVAQMSGLSGAAKLAGYVCGIVVLEHHADAPAYAVYRFLETVLGIGVAVIVSFVPRLIAAEPAAERHP